MAKRFTDSRKWTDPWFRKLPSSYRWLWLYILDTCSHIGIWKTDFDLASFSLGDDVDPETALKLFNGRIIVLGEEKWFVPKFITFQYGALSEDGRLHNKIIKDLAESLPKDLFEELQITPCQQGVNTLKDKDKDSLVFIQELIDCWNSKESLSNVSVISSTRKSKIKERYTSRHFRDSWKKAIDKVAASSFCCGDNERKWRASIDWFIANDTNYAKALEGKYDDKKSIFQGY